VKADKVLLNGRIITIDVGDAVEEALAVTGDRITFVGSAEEAKGHIASGTMVIDLAGKAVSPGFVDSHNHTVEYGFSGFVLDLRYPAVKSIEGIKRLVKEAAASKPEGTWLRGVGWDEALLEERRAPTRFDLDPVSPRHPVILDAQTPYQVANTCAHNLVGHECADDYDGLLSINDLAYRMRLLSRDYSVEECEEAILKAQDMLFGVGVTAHKEAGATDAMIQAYRNLHSRGELKIRSYIMVGIHNGRTSVELAKEAVTKYKPCGDDVLYIGAVKCSFDGSGGNRTAWLYEPWNREYTGVDEGNYGGPIVPEPQTYPEICRILHRAGFQIGAHCVGDRTIDECLKAIEAAIIDHPRADCRHSVIHNNLPTDNALRKETAMGSNIVVEATSAYLYFIGDTYAGNFGPHRSRRLIPMRTLMDRGVVVGNGCDWNTCLTDPVYGIHAAVTRRPRLGVYGDQPFGTDECIGVTEALRTYTWNSAYCMFWEDKIGSLEKGKYADLVVWNRDPLAQPKEKILDLKVERTMLGGEWVYGD
jgi:predicted amidohydrolase YtcJ